MAIEAIILMRRMRGGAQSQLVLGSDNNLWVVKFQNNPQHLRVLANEFIATQLAARIGLTVPETAIINVSSWLIANSPNNQYELGRREGGSYVPGLQFGSKLVGGLLPASRQDYMSGAELGNVRNLKEFTGILAFDKWTGNCDGRQAVFTRRQSRNRYVATFIDQGFCFNAGEWTFPDAPLQGIYPRRQVYEAVSGWHSFEPWLSRIENLHPGILWEIAARVPPEWYSGNFPELERLIDKLISRRARVRELIESFRNSNKQPFPNWMECPPVGGVSECNPADAVAQPRPRRMGLQSSDFALHVG